MTKEKTGTAEMQKAMATIDRLTVFEDKIDTVLSKLDRLERLLVQHHGNQAPPLSLYPGEYEE